MKFAYVLLLSALLLSPAAMAQDENGTDNGLPNENQPIDVEDDTNFMSVFVLVGFAAAAFLLAKYGP